MGEGKESKKGRAPSLVQSPSHLLHRAQQVAADEFAARLSKGGLTVRQYAVLTAVADNPGLTQSGLVRLTGVDRSTLADLIARLQERGLVARDRLEEDGRAKSVTLTPAGRDALAASKAKAVAADEAILALLPKGKRELFVTLLQRLSGITEADLEKEQRKARKGKAAKDKKASKQKGAPLASAKTPSKQEATPISAKSPKKTKAKSSAPKGAKKKAQIKKGATAAKKTAGKPPVSV